jgi:AcrR family transcriptional regulator
VRPRHREGTEKILLAAVEALLIQGESLGVNAVAKAADVDKVLVYRYFGDLEGLLQAYAKSERFWPHPAELLHDRDALMAMPFVERFCLLFKRYAAALRERPATLAIMASEVVSRAPWHAPIETAREEFGRAMFELAHDAPAHFDVAAISSVASSAIHYLLLRARHIEVFNGIALRTEAGFSRIELAIESMLRGAAALPQPPD